MLFYDKGNPEVPCAGVRLYHGDMVIMTKQSQQHFSHCVPPGKTRMGTRLSITFRSIKPNAKNVAHSHNRIVGPVSYADTMASSPMLTNPNVSNRSDVIMDLLIEYNLTVLNDRTPGDLFGAFTYVNYSGASTIDYFAVSPTLLHSSNYLQVDQLNEYSDHKPLFACFSFLKIPNSNDTTFNFATAPMPYKWDKTQTPDFLKAQEDSVTPS